MVFLSQNIEWPDEMDQLLNNFYEHLGRKHELRESKSQMTSAELLHALKREVRRYHEEDQRILAAWDQRERQERQAEEKDHQKREQHNPQRLERLAKKQEEQEDA